MEDESKLAHGEASGLKGKKGQPILKKRTNIFRYEPADRLDRGAAIIKQLLKIYIQTSEKIEKEIGG